ncbi:MAG: hypothetical protein M1318_06415 [Firmicutes bacterium]|nr:hypothetical protein [Bacillota bacterium]
MANIDAQSQQSAIDDVLATIVEYTMNTAISDPSWFSGCYWMRGDQGFWRSIIPNAGNLLGE